VNFFSFVSVTVMTGAVSVTVSVSGCSMCAIVRCTYARLTLRVQRVLYVTVLNRLESLLVAYPLILSFRGRPSNAQVVRAIEDNILHHYLRDAPPSEVSFSDSRVCV
jgi:hypothetical protein